MEIIVQVTYEELKEMGVDISELSSNIVGDLDDARSYSGFNVKVVISDEKEII